MTGYFAQGRRERYPYYQCFRRDCPTRTKSYSASSVHDEFSELLADTSLPHYLATGIVTEILAAYSEKTEQIRQVAARRREEEGRLKLQLHELISMRAARLVSDEEFVAQRERIRRQLLEIQANNMSDADMPLMGNDITDLTDALSKLNVAWQLVPLAAKRGFGELAFPAGYVFQRIRTAEKGLLFRTFGTYDGRTSDVVPLLKENLNTIIVEIRRFLAIIRHGKEARKEAA